MSTTVPARRALRTTRTTTAKDNENANARPSRISTRAKPPSSTSNNATFGVVGRATGTAALRAKTTANGEVKVDQPAVKRKREALGELTSQVTNHRKSLGNKGKGKETTQLFDGVVINKSKTLTNRQPLRTVATRQSSKIVVAKDETLERIKETIEAIDDNAMAVDPPNLPILPSLTIPKSLAPIKEVPSRQAGRRSVKAQPELVDELEAGRVFKKPRTSDASEGDYGHDQGRFAGEDALAAKYAAELQALENEPEADPDGAEWEDLDADDVDDPLMVSEYVVEIFEYFKKIEVTTMPNPNYMANQKDLGWAMRGILSDWLIELQERFRLLPETLFLCLNLIDRFLSARVVSLARLQLVGVTCMFLAAKVEEIICPSAEELLAQTEASYTVSDVFNAEKYVLKTLNWNVNFANPVHFLRRVSKADDYNVKTRTIAKYLLEIACLEWRLIAAPPSLLAAAALWLARLSLGMEDWTPNLAHYASYPESALIPTANLMLNYVLKPIKHEAFYRKYARRKYMKVSVYVRRWALDHWSEGTMVDLSAELPGIKAEIRALRAHEPTSDC